MSSPADADVADRAEMASLLEGCRSARITHELRHWLPHPSAAEVGGLVTAPVAASDMAADCEEMTSLLEGCRRQRVRQELSPWLEEMRRACIAGGAGEDGDEAPLVVVAGSRGVGKRRLLRALTGADVGSDPGCCSGQIETKYYTARVRYRVVDLTEEGPALALDGDEACLLLWDPQRPSTFGAVRRAVPSGGDEDEVLADAVRLCVAASAEDGAEVASGAVEDEARSWCADAGYEFLACRLDDEALGLLAARRLGEQEASLLGGDDTDGTALRILEALECHTWPGLEMRAGGGGGLQREVDFRPPPRDGEATSSADPSTAPPLVLLAAASSAVPLARNMLGALAPAAEAGATTAEAVLQTKYFTAKLRFKVGEVQVPSVGGAECLEDARAAAGLVLLLDASQAVAAAAFESLRELCRAAGLGAATDGPIARCGVRLLAVVGPAVWDAEPARLWCAESGFEYLRCTLGDEDLAAVRARWRSGGGGARLLGDDGAEDAGAVRLVEAFESHAWPGLEPRPEGTSRAEGAASAEDVAESTAPAPSATLAAAGPPARGGGASDEGGGAASVEAIERFAEEIRAVRSVADEASRRERACEVAMRLAEALGVDSDSDE